tara:strand:+ start:992 stop:1762 length:771 start_codon:yes stop_codon:yes gene_type:complete
MKIINIYPKQILLLIFPLFLTFSSAQEDDPLGLSANAALQKIQAQYGQYFADKIVEIRGFRGQSQPREWTVVVNDERSQLRLRSVRVSIEKTINEGESTKFYPNNLPTGFASSDKIKIDSTKAFQVLIKEARAAKIGFDYVDYKLRSLEFGDEPIWVLSAMKGKGILLGQVVMSAYDANLFRTVWYYRGDRGYIKVVDSALDGIKKNQLNDEALSVPGGDNQVSPKTNTGEASQSNQSNSSGLGTEEAEVKPIRPN